MEHPSPRTSYQLTFAVILLAVGAYSFLQSVVVPVLPTIQRDLHTSQNTVTWVLTAYLLSASIATPIVGRIGDMVGKKKVLVVTLCVLAIGSIMAALATTIGVMIVARVIQGVGGAVLPLSFGIIRDEFPREKVTSAIGIAAALLGVGGGAGIVLAGPIVGALDFHFLFWIPLVMVGFAAIAALIVIPESAVRTPGRVSWLAAILLSGWLVALILSVSKGQQWGWGSTKTIGLVGIAVVIGVGWILVEVRSDHPLIDMRMMRNPSVWRTNLVALLFGAGMYSVFAFLPQFVQTPTSAGYGFGASTTASGLFLLPASTMIFIFALISGRIAARTGSRLILLVGSFCTIPSYALLTFSHSERWEIFVASSMLGIGLGFSFSAMSNLIVESVPATQVGVASGMNANIRTIGGSIGAAIVASIVTAKLQGSGLPVSSGYRNGFAFLTVTAILATLACLIIPKPKANELDLIEHAHVIEHAETALVAGAGLVDESFNFDDVR